MTIRRSTDTIAQYFVGLASTNLALAIGNYNNNPIKNKVESYS
jgi:hypothetical protein